MDLLIDVDHVLGGPLELGDIEDLDGTPTLYCPWHHYDFNLKTGKSSTGLEVRMCLFVDMLVGCT